MRFAIIGAIALGFLFAGQHRPKCPPTGTYSNLVCYGPNSVGPRPVYVQAP